MTDLLSVMFMIGISLILMLVAMIIRNTVLIIVAGLGWVVTSIFLFGLYATGDPDYSYSVYGFAWMCVLLAMTCFIYSWWSHRKKTLQMADDKTGETFYTEGDPEFKEINDMYKARANKKKLRGR
jgi:hypothetical protein